MKTNLIGSLLLYLSLSMLSGCSTTFIDVKNPTAINTDDYFTDAISVKGAVNAAYSGLQANYSPGGSGSASLFLFTMTPSDDNGSGPDSQTTQDFDLFSVGPSNVNLVTWSSFYRTIAKCNLVISRTPAVQMDEALKARYIAEVKFIRALTYFNLVRIWGDVPLVTKEITEASEAYTYNRVSVDKVYEQIIQDLKDAETALPATFTGTELGRATSGSAKAILGKVYLTRKDYALAATKLNEVITANTFSLLPNYTDIFPTTNEMNKEIIFAVRYTRGGVGEGSAFMFTFVPTGSASDSLVKSGRAFGMNYVTPDLFNAFTPGDKRKFASIGLNYLSTDVNRKTPSYYIKKYVDILQPVEGDAENDFIVIRYADVLLMYAEALNELGKTSDAEPFINQTLTRAGLPAIAPGLSQTSFRLALEKERRLELCLEGHRWFDLLRTGRAIEVMNVHFTKYSITGPKGVVTIGPNNLLFPLPLYDIQANPALTQNPGY